MKSHLSMRRLLVFTGALAVAIPVLVGRGHVRVAAQSAGHFKPFGPDKSQARDDSLFFPNDFEAAVARRPHPAGPAFFCLGRPAPFTSPALLPASPGSTPHP